MVEFRNANEAARLNKLVNDARRAKREASPTKRDRWGLPMPPKGWVRGMVSNVRSSDEPCPFGTLQVLEFELRDDPQQPGVPVRMAGTNFDRLVVGGEVMDVRDPTPSVRPIEAVRGVFSHTRYMAEEGIQEIKAYYPGRDDMTPRRNLALATAMVVVPVVLLIVAVVMLRYVFHILQ